jgi:DNA segregation ATPase FtsK/SpoIIIE-like protein
MHTLDCFERPPKRRVITDEEIHALEQLLHDTINGICSAEVRHEYTLVGPSIIRFGIRPSARTQPEQIMRYQLDIQAALCVRSIRMVLRVPGEPYVGVEIPNPHPTPVLLRDILESSEYQAARSVSKLVFALGQDVTGQIHFCDIAQAPHLFIAGGTGSGKSMLLNTLMACLLTQVTPDDVRFLMIDPKRVECSVYNGIPHLLQPIVTDSEQAVPLLDDVISETERRYQIFRAFGVCNLSEYRQLREQRQAEGANTLENLPAIVMIVNELAAPMMAAKEEVEPRICRLAEVAQSTGIHLVIATQRPSVDIITERMKAHIAARIALTVSAYADSQTIIDQRGAESLLGRGDMLYRPSDAPSPTRIQGAFVTEQDVQRLVACLATLW